MSRRLAPRSLAPPRSPKVCAPHRAACSRRSCSASQPGRRAGSRPHRTARRRPARLAPRSGSPRAVCLRSCGCLLRSHPPHRSKSAAVARAPSAVFPRAPQAPFRVLLRRGEKNEKNVPVSIQLSHISHPCLRIQLATEFMALPGGYYMPNSREGRGRYGQIDSGLGQGSWPELPRDEYLA